MSFNYKITKNSSLPEVLEIIPDHFDDHRGSLWTSFSTEIYENELLDKKIKFHHDKFSYTKKHALRGIHGDKKSWKLVCCPFGKVFQVVVDARKDSKNFMVSVSTILSDENKKMLLIPPMFGNGFCALDGDVLYHYKLAYRGKYFDASEQFTIKWNDSKLNINWPIKSPLLSERDE